MKKEYRNKPLSDEVKKSKKQESRIRACVEHVFLIHRRSYAWLLMYEVLVLNELLKQFL